MEIVFLNGQSDLRITVLNNSIIYNKTKSSVNSENRTLLGQYYCMTKEDPVRAHKLM